MPGTNLNDTFDLRRFVRAQEGNYEQALAEIKGGRKRTHWMWFVFPQIDGLGFSPMAKKYAIKSIDEAREYPSRTTPLTSTIQAIASAQRVWKSQTLH